MRKVLVTYDTKSASTAEISHIVGAELASKGYRVDIRLVEDVDRVTPYDIIVVGSPIRLSKCTRKVSGFVRKHLDAMCVRPTAFFFTCMSMIELKDKALPRIPIYADPSFDSMPRERCDLSYFEYFHTSWVYLNNFLTLIPKVQPVHIAFFKGRLDFTRLSLSQRMIMSLASWLSKEIRQGDYVNPQAVCVWVDKLCWGLQTVADSRWHENTVRDDV